MPSNARAGRLAPALSEALIQARRDKGLSQAALGLRVGLPQTHISGIETGRVVPRFDTLLDIVRVLDFDLLLVPRDLVPVVDALILDRSLAARRAGAIDDDAPLYQPDEEGLIISGQSGPL